MGNLNNKLVVITGASRGIGAATAHAMAEEGARVVLLARTESDLAKQVEQIEKAGGKAAFYPVDLSRHEAVVEVAEKILAEQGAPDVLVNSAGVGRWLFVHETPPEEAEFIAKVPYLAAFWLTSALLPSMLQRKQGRIINVNSPVSIMVWGGAAAYAASRWAMRGFSESLKVDLEGTGVSVCHCVFGEVTSSYFEDNPGSHERLPKISKLLPVSSPEQVAKWLQKVSKNKQRELTKPTMLWLFRVTMAIAPWLVKGLVRKSSYKIRHLSDS